MQLLYFVSFALCVSVLVSVPLRYKWELHQIHIWYGMMCIAGIVNGCLSAAIMHHFQPDAFILTLIIDFGLTIVEVPIAILPVFYRDPKRVSPQESGAIVSPADGKVVYIKKVEQGEVPLSIKLKTKINLQELAGTELISQGSYLIGISMNFLDVHVNRSPIGGTIRRLTYVPGQFFSLRHADSVVKNERQSLLIDNGVFQVGVVQISSRLVRRIVAFVKQDEEVKIGQRIGAIRFGSQVDVVLPDDPRIRVKVRENDIVKAGVTILASVSGD
jgi:phosphatidylserine decarboxylase